MRNLKIGLIATTAFIIAGITAPATASAPIAPGDKVAICHTANHAFDAFATPGGLGGGFQCLAGEGKVTLIVVSVSSCRAHLGAACPE